MSALHENIKVLVSGARKLGVDLRVTSHEDSVLVENMDVLHRIVSYRLGERSAESLLPRADGSVLYQDFETSIGHVRSATRSVSDAISAEWKEMEDWDYDLLAVCAKVLPRPLSFDADVGEWSHLVGISTDPAQRGIERAVESGYVILEEGILRLSGDFDLRALLNRMHSGRRVRPGLLAELIDAAVREGKLSARRA